MITHDLLSFSAMLLAGIVGALIANPLGLAARTIADRVRVTGRRR